MNIMKKLMGNLWSGGREDQEYQPLDHDESVTPLEASTATLAPEDTFLSLSPDEATPFSWLEYSIFTLLGVAMLWAWNMFLAAAPYFSSRFKGNPWIETNFQSTILAVSTMSSLVSVILLTNIQQSASYPLRINMALVINVVIFALLTLSTIWFLGVAPRVYFGFTLAMVAITAWATGLIQNGAFSFCASFGRPEYMQALMTGQGIAGVLPAIAQVVSVLIFPPSPPNEKSPSSSPSFRRDASESPPTPDAPTEGHTSAFIYFSAAAAISVVTVLAFIPLTRRYHQILQYRTGDPLSESITSAAEEHAAERASRKDTSLWVIFLKLRWLALGVALVFAETMFFPVFTAKIHSVREGRDGLFFQPEVFIPLGFFFWNAGDFAGRLLAAVPNRLRSRPPLLFLLTVLRAAWIPLYLLGNINGRGAALESDFFYLFVVQLGFGLTNGFLGSTFMMSTGDWVDDGEREAAGGFMGLCLVAGLTCGSLLSFSVSGI